MEQLITQHLTIWTQAQEEAKSGKGRGKQASKQSPYGIKKLRELILELAVRGKLVPQDPNDEPASVLLEKVAEEKAILVKEKKIKKQKKLPEIIEEEKPFDLPAGWEWGRLLHFCVLENGDRSKNYPNKSALVDEGIPFINAGHLNNGQIDMREMNFISPDRYRLLKSGKVQEGDILYCLRGSLGKNAIVHDIGQGAIASSLVIVRLTFQELNQYIVNYLDSPLANRTMRQYDNGTAQPNLSAASLGSFAIPLPPLAEQQRIVAKVDDLMALCDQLEEQQNASQQTHQSLVETLLATLTNATTPEDCAAAWHHLAPHFNTLFTTDHAITLLKQTILQLAVMGKLVPQDPEDEPGKMLLDGLQNVEGKSKKRPKWSGPIEEQEKLFKLPSSWTWFRLGDLSNLKHGYAFKSEHFSAEPAPFVLTTPGNFYEKGGFRDRESKRKYYNGPVDPHFVFEPGDLIIPMTEQAAGLLGSPAFIPDDGRVYIHNQRIGKFDFSDSIAPEFAFCFFNCEFFRSELARTCTGMKVRHTSPDRILRVPFPVCPLEEQHRIVAKVDELLALCDQLQNSLTTQRTTTRHLADALSSQVINGSPSFR